MDSSTLRSLDENAAEKAHHICSVEKVICLARRHVFLDHLYQEITPCPILSAHMLAVSSVLLFVTLEKALCIVSASSIV